MFDAPAKARRLADREAGLTVPDEEVSAERIRSDVLRLLQEPLFVAGASRLRDEVMAQPNPNQVASQLAQLVTGGQPSATGGEPERQPVAT